MAKLQRLKSFQSKVKFKKKPSRQARWFSKKKKIRNYSLIGQKRNDRFDQIGIRFLNIQIGFH